MIPMPVTDKLISDYFYHVKCDNILAQLRNTLIKHRDIIESGNFDIEVSVVPIKKVNDGKKFHPKSNKKTRSSSKGITCKRRGKDSTIQVKKSRALQKSNNEKKSSPSRNVKKTT